MTRELNSARARALLLAYHWRQGLRGPHHLRACCDLVRWRSITPDDLAIAVTALPIALTPVRELVSRITTVAAPHLISSRSDLQTTESVIPCGRTVMESVFGKKKWLTIS